MADHHGIPPDPAETAWSLPVGKDGKTKAAPTTQGQGAERKNENAAAEPEIQTIGGNMPMTTMGTTEKSIVTRVNFTVQSNKGITKLSIPNSMHRFIAIIKEGDPKATLVCTDEDGNEREFAGTAKLPKDSAINQEISHRYLQGLKLTKRNTLVGMLTVKTSIEFKTIMKNQIVRNNLNIAPKIFFRENKIDTIEPTLVGFFTNISPRADRPELFEERIKKITSEFAKCPSYQLDHCHLHAAGTRCNVVKMMTNKEDKETMRRMMNLVSAELLQEDKFVPETEFYSLSTEDKVKLLTRQMEYAKNYRTVFIDGFKNIDHNTKSGTNEEGTITQWLMSQKTSSNEPMFTRIYKPSNGTTELLVQNKNIREALDWSRLAVSEATKLVNDQSLHEIFTDPIEAVKQASLAPEWVPHQLSKKVAEYVMPEKTIQPRRHQPIAIDYAAANNTAKKAPRPNRNSSKQKKTVKEPKEETPAQYEVIKTMTDRMEVEENFEETIHETTGKEKPANKHQSGSHLPPPPNPTIPAGKNPYKMATEVQDKRLLAIEQQLFLLHAANQQTNKKVEMQIQQFRGCIQEKDKEMEQKMAKAEEESKNRHKETEQQLEEFRGQLDTTSEAVQRIENKTSKMIDTMLNMNQEATDNASNVTRTIEELQGKIADSIAELMQQAIKAMMERETTGPKRAIAAKQETAPSPDRVHKSKKAIVPNIFNTPEKVDRMETIPAAHKTTWDLIEEEANKEAEEREQFHEANLTFRSWQKADMDIEAGSNPSSPNQNKTTSSRTEEGPAEDE